MSYPDDEALAKLQEYFRNREMRSTFSAITELRARRNADPSLLEIAAIEADLENKKHLMQEFPPDADPSFDDLELARCVSGLDRLLSFYQKDRARQR